MGDQQNNWLSGNEDGGIMGPSAWSNPGTGLFACFPPPSVPPREPLFPASHFPVVAAPLVAQIANTAAGHDRLTVAIQRSPESPIGLCPRPGAFSLHPHHFSLCSSLPPPPPLAPFLSTRPFFPGLSLPQLTNYFLLIHSTSPPLLLPILFLFLPSSSSSLLSNAFLLPSSPSSSFSLLFFPGSAFNILLSSFFLFFSFSLLFVYSRSVFPILWYFPSSASY
ncbi:hypothetical protein ACMYSQ_006394 [Aspergillus niger]